MRLNYWILAVFAVALIGMLYTPFDAYSQDFVNERLMGMSGVHWFGVDHLGQDVLSRVWLGAGNSVGYAFLASVFTMLMGCGLLWGERSGGWVVSSCIRSLVSLGIALPVLLLGLTLMMFLPREPFVLVVAISVAGVPFVFRQIRVLWLEQQSAGYVVASRAIGGDSKHVFFFSILPNMRPQFLELWKVAFSIALLELSSLTFLGLAGDPNWAELGSLLRGYQKHIFVQPMLVVWPGVVLVGLLLLVRQIRTD